MASQYVPVQPEEHAAGCSFRRPTGQGDNDARAFDTAHCARCRALWQRVVELDGPAVADPGTLPPTLGEMAAGK